MKLLRFIPALACIVACTPQETPTPSRSALFETQPQRLFEAFESSCSGPGKVFEKIGKQAFECSEYLPPKAAAYLILNYDGFPQDLPQSVMRLTSSKTGSGYRVDARSYFKVPQKTGAIVEVPLESDALDQAISSLYLAMGGTPT
ncbi:hypothetical protein OU790_10170 [Ruegeria sp. NA]|nr:hypothetical protein [Ruegeria sp. NA]MCX8953799.1 hypothetical protein [Ruegeria sp. NA]